MTLRFSLAASAGCLGLLVTAAPVAAQPELRSVVVASSTAQRVGGRALTAKRYSTDYGGNAIRRSSLDGSAAEVLIADVKGPYGLGFDAATRQLIWTSATDEVVQAAPVDGGTAVVLESSFEEGFAIVVDEGHRKVAYGLSGSQIIKVTEDRQTGAEQREVLLDLVSPDLVHGLALTADHTALYLGDDVGQMSQKLTLASRTVVPLAFEAPPPPAPLPLAPPAPQPELAR